MIFFFYSLFIVDGKYLQISAIVLLYKLQQTNTNRLHLASYSRGGSRDFEKESRGALCRQPWLADEGNFRFQMV